MLIYYMSHLKHLNSLDETKIHLHSIVQDSILNSLLSAKNYAFWI